MNIKRMNIALRICLISPLTELELGDERKCVGELNTASDESLLCTCYEQLGAISQNRTSPFCQRAIATFFLSTHVKVFERSQFKVISDLLR